MSYNLDDFLSDAKEIFDKVTTKAGEAVDYSKGQFERAHIKTKIKEKYAQLGKMYFDSQDTGVSDLSAVGRLCKEIRELKNEIEVSEKQGSAISGVCRFCGTKNEPGNVFCGKCGERL
jgi:hypothetical protein